MLHTESKKTRNYFIVSKGFHKLLIFILQGKTCRKTLYIL